MEKICLDCGRPFDAISRARTCIYCREKHNNILKIQYNLEHRPAKREVFYAVSPEGKIVTTRHCKSCGTEFRITHPSMVYCSDRCRERTKKRFNPEPRKLRVLAREPEMMNRTGKNTDREVLRKKRIESPALSALEFRFYDKRMKSTFYFSSAAKYEKFVQNYAQ